MKYTKEQLAVMSHIDKNKAASKKANINSDVSWCSNKEAHMLLSNENKINIMHNVFNDECTACVFDKNGNVTSSTSETYVHIGEAIVNVFLMMDISQ